MRDWSEVRRSRFDLRKVSPETFILARVTEGLDKYYQRKKGKFRITELLDVNVLRDYCQSIYTINEWMFVSPKCIKNYNSWLYKIKDGGSGVIIATEHEKNHARILPKLAEWAQGRCVAVFRFLTLLAHEIGHVALEHKLTEVTKLRDAEKYPAMNPEHEWEAWLFAEYLRAFILADYSVETRQNEQRDGAPDLFL